MRNRESIRMILSERDRAALVLISEFGFVFARQVWVKAWPETKTIAMAYDRLSLMVKAGFLLVVSIPGIRENVYTTTKEGLAVAQIKHHRPLPKRRPSIIQALHQITLLDIRLRFEFLGAKDWTAGESLKVTLLGKDNYHIPDAVYLNKDGFKLALEYDRSRRSNERVRSRLNFYDALTKLNLVSGLVYVVSPAFYEAYEKLIKVHGIKKIILRTTDQILSGNL